MNKLSERDLDERIAEKQQAYAEQAVRSKRHADILYDICEKLLILAAGGCAGFALAFVIKWAAA